MDPLPVAVRLAGYVDLLPLIGLAAAGILVSAAGLLMLAAGMAGTGLWPVDGAMLRMVAGETAVGWAFLARLAALAVVAGIALATPAWAGHAVMRDGVAWRGGGSCWRIACICWWRPAGSVRSVGSCGGCVALRKR